MKIQLKQTFMTLTALLICISSGQAIQAEDKTTNLFSFHNKQDKFHYYSSPAGSAYIHELPDGYYHINTNIEKDLDPKTTQEGERVNFKVNETLKVSDFLTIPAGSTISGTLARVQTPRKIIRSSRIRVHFDKIISPTGYELPLNKKTIEVRPLVVKKGARYEPQNELWYGAVIGGAKYPISRFLNTPVSLAISGGAGLVSGLAYSMFAGEPVKNTGLGTLRGLGGKAIYSFGFLSGRNFIIEPDQNFTLTVDATNVENMRYDPQYLNVEQMMMASALGNNDEKFEAALISKAQSNSNANKIIRYYKDSAQNAPDNIDTQINFGKSLIESSRFQKAIEHFETLLENGNNDPRIYYNLAVAREQSGQLFEAKANYETALELNYPDKEIYLQIANLCKKIGSSEDAARYFDLYNNSILAVK
jgi:hypothetical protein